MFADVCDRCHARLACAIMPLEMHSVRGGCRVAPGAGGGGGGRVASARRIPVAGSSRIVHKQPIPPRGGVRGLSRLLPDLKMASAFCVVYFIVFAVPVATICEFDSMNNMIMYWIYLKTSAYT